MQDMNTEQFDRKHMLMYINYLTRTHIDEPDDTYYSVDPLLFERGCFALRSRNANRPFFLAGIEFPGILTSSRHILSNRGILAICKI